MTETNNHEVTDPLNCAAKSLFGLSYLFPYQRLVITNMLEAAQANGIPIKWTDQGMGIPETEDERFINLLSDRETSGKQIVILPTGAGKSLCFQLPAMMIDGLTLVIYPILSLMADQQRRLYEKGFSPVTIRGGQTKEERDEIWAKLETGQSRFIIANPEVLLTPQVKERLKNINVTHVVIDEAHCVSEWGESFRPGYLEIGSIVNSLNPPLVTAFTATASSPVLEKIRKYIFSNSESKPAVDVRLIMGNPDRPNISYSAMGCINRNLAVRDLLIKHARPAIVFCSSRPGTERLARYLINELKEMDFAWHNEIRFYHAGLSKEEKTEIEKWLLHNQEAVLVSTCAFGMGIDKSDIRTVIHRDIAPSVESYLQESGRAGRDGRQSTAVLLWGPDDETAIERIKGDTARQRFSLLMNYARDTKKCRRHSLLAMLNYDSDEAPEKLCCDVCNPQDGKKTNDTLREEASVLDFFRRNRRRFTYDEAVSVLAESKTIKWSEEDASMVIGYLLKSKKLKRIKNFLWKNKITAY